VIQQGERLRKVSDYAFEEVDPPEDRNKPLQWQRHFTPVHLPLTRVKVVTSCKVHDTDYVWHEKEEPDDPLDLVTPNITQNVSIWATADPEQTRDTLVCMANSDDDSDIYTADIPRGDIQVSIRSGQPAEHEDGRSDGAYHGTAFRFDFEPGEDHVHLELIIPRQHLDYLISALRADDNPTLEVLVDLLGFTYELDDAFREHYHPRKILMDEATPCFATNIAVTNRIRSNNAPHTPDETEMNEDEQLENDEYLTPQERQYQNLINTLSSFSKQLHSITTAIWILVIIVAVFSFSALS